MSSVSEALSTIQRGECISLTTPTGKEFEAELDMNECLVLRNQNTGYTQSGQQALKRLKTCLRATGTEWSA